MPCSSNVPDHDPIRELRDEVREMRSSIENKRSALKEELDLVTRLLCEVLTENPQVVKSEELSIWWKRHQKFDKSRKGK